MKKSDEKEENFVLGDPKDPQYDLKQYKGVNYFMMRLFEYFWNFCAVSFFFMIVLVLFFVAKLFYMNLTS